MGRLRVSSLTHACAHFLVVRTAPSLPASLPLFAAILAAERRGIQPVPARMRDGLLFRTLGLDVLARWHQISDRMLRHWMP